MASGKRIVGVLFAIFGLMRVVFSVAVWFSSPDRQLTFTVIGPFPYFALVVGSVLLVGGVKLVTSAGRNAVQTAETTASGATATSSATALAALGVMALGGWYYFGGGLQMQTNRTLQEIHDKVAAHAVAQYGIAKRNGTPIVVCVQAGMVAAAYLQAQSEPQYQQWKQTEQADCATAGIEKWPG